MKFDKEMVAKSAELDNDPDCPKLLRPDEACEAWLNSSVITSLAESLGVPKGALPDRGPTFRNLLENSNGLDMAKMAFVSGYTEALESLKAMAIYKATKLGIPLPAAEAEFGPMVPTVEAPTTKQ